MPFVNVKLVEGVFSEDEKHKLAKNLTDVLVEFKGSEAFREVVVWVLIEELHPDGWHIGGRPWEGPRSLITTLQKSRAIVETLDGVPQTRAEVGESGAGPERRLVAEWARWPANPAGQPPTMSGLLKLLFPAGGETETEVEELLRISMESRKRVKDQLKRIDSTYPPVDFHFVSKAGRKVSVTTLEEDEYPQFYHLHAAGDPKQREQAGLDWTICNHSA